MIYDGVEEDSEEEEATEDDLGDEVPTKNRTEERREAKQVSSSREYKEEDESELSADEEDKLKGPTKISTSTSLGQVSLGECVLHQKDIVPAGFISGEAVMSGPLYLIWFN
ncbi:hypothetical protein U1Q18_045139 [Sarracenia purpurea var. burkii]